MEVFVQQISLELLTLHLFDLEFDAYLPQH
jgi:hypothetical protein